MARNGGQVGRKTSRRSAKYLSLDEKPLPTLPASTRASVVSSRTLQERNKKRERATYPASMARRTSQRKSNGGGIQRQRSIRAAETTSLVLKTAFGELSDRRKTHDGQTTKLGYLIPSPIKDGEVHPALRDDSAPKERPRERVIHFDPIPRTYIPKPTAGEPAKKRLRSVPSVPELLLRLQPHMGRSKGKKPQIQESIPEENEDQEQSSKQTSIQSSTTSLPLKRPDPVHPADPSQVKEVRPIDLVRALRKLFTERRPRRSNKTEKDTSDVETPSSEPASSEDSATVQEVIDSRPINRVITPRPVKRRGSKLAGRSQRRRFPLMRMGKNANNESNSAKEDSQESGESETAEQRQEALRRTYTTLSAAAEKRKADERQSMNPVYSLAAKKRQEIETKQEPSPSSPMSMWCKGIEPETTRSIETTCSQATSDEYPQVQAMSSLPEVLSVEEESTAYDLLLFSEATMGDSYFGSFAGTTTPAVELEDHEPEQLAPIPEQQSRPVTTVIDVEDHGRRASAMDLEEHRPATPALTVDGDEPIESLDSTPAKAPAATQSTDSVGRSSSVYSTQSTRLPGAEADNWVHVGSDREEIPISAEDLLGANPYLLYNEHDDHENTTQSLKPHQASGILYLNRSSTSDITAMRSRSNHAMPTPII